MLLARLLQICECHCTPRIFEEPSSKLSLCYDLCMPHQEEDEAYVSRRVALHV